MLVVAATAGWAFEEEGPVGLAGILPDEVPAGLADDDWAVLDGNWAEWSTGTSAAVADLYTGEMADVAAQRAAIAKLRIKLGTMEKSLADPAYAIIHDKLADLHGRLLRRVELAEAVLNTLEADLAGAKAARTAAAWQAVSGALEAVKSDIASIPGGNAWLPYIRAEQLAAAAAANDTSEEAVKLLTAVKGKIDGRASLSAEQAGFLGRESFLGLAAAIDGVVTANAWAPPENYQARVREGSQKLLTALETYEIDGNRASAAEAEQAYQALNEIAADGGAAITAAMRRHYFNYNVRIIASEGLMNRFAGDTKREQSPISEAVSGAWVSGTSYTTTNVGIDLKPGTDAALFDVVVRGNVQSSTVASASQQGVNANIWGGSTGSFEGRRPVTFDGKSFRLGATSVAVNASTYASSAQTDAFFLFRGIANSMALGQAQSRRGQSDAYARQKIRDQVTQEMGDQSTSKFENANVELESKLYGPLRELGWHPDQIQLSSTDTALAAQARLMNPDELGAQVPSLVPAPPAKGLVIQVHESLLNNGSDRLDIAGKTLSDEELKQLIEERISKLLGREFKFSKPEDAAPPQPGATAPEGAQPAEEPLPDETGKKNTYVFDTHDPLRFQVDNGTVTIILRTGLKREGDEEIPLHVIEVPLAFHIEGGQVVMNRAGSVRVVPGPGVQGSIGRQQIMRSNIQKSLPERTFKGSFDVTQQDKTITLNVTSISAGDGWVTVTAE
jgi:hypothetical protein